MKLTLENVKNNPKIKTFVKRTEDYLDSLGFTDHGPRHLEIVASRAMKLAREIGLSKNDQELCGVAGYCHDMGNFLGRSQHHYWGAMLLSQVYLNEIDNPDDVARVMQAIVSHDKSEIKIVSKITAVLILADKSDVHRDRVRDRRPYNIKEDIHDRVNYSVTKNDFKINKQKREITLKLQLDIKVTDPIEYFEIFLERMIFCREAARYLNYKFVLIINNFKLS